MEIELYDELRQILQRDDVDRLGAALDQGLAPDLWLDVDSRDSLLAIAITAGSRACAEALLDADGDWARQAPFDADQVSPLGLAIEAGHEIQQIFIERGAVAAYSIDWLVDALGSFLSRDLLTSDLEWFEALGERPEGLGTLFQPHADGLNGLRQRVERIVDEPAREARWQQVAADLATLSASPSQTLAQVDDLSYKNRKSALRDLLPKLAEPLRRQAAGLALSRMVGREEWDFARELIDLGADCDWYSSHLSYTALMEAVFHGNLGFVRLLLERGADPGRRNDDGDRALDRARTPLMKKFLAKEMAQRARG